MDELLLHVIDLVENSLASGAGRIVVAIREDYARDRVEISVEDDGRGMDEKARRNAQDPFFTSKNGKRVGLGLPLFKQTAEATGGTFFLDSEPGKGTKVTASFGKSHLDRPPLGNLPDTVLTLLVMAGEVDLEVHYERDGMTKTIANREIQDALEGIPLTYPAVITFLKQYVQETFGSNDIERPEIFGSS